ncbi:MAG TPA: DegQ family serine endoprotease, partial [Stellaceae bacterium]|nr:DegQ family serine endoprotease [Stellaceae bacterium]
MSSLPARSSAPKLRLATLVAGVALSLAFSPVTGVAPAHAQSNSPLAAALPSFAPLVKKVMPAVVNVSATLKPGTAATEDQMSNGDQGQDQDQDQDQNQDQGPDLGGPGGSNRGFPQSPFDEMLRKFFEQQGRPMPRQGQEHTVALGSGFIIDPSGYIVTNNHVVQNADKVTVIFQDNSEHAAKVIGRDTKTDLALLKIEAPKPLPYVSWGNSDSEQVGDWVLAVGNPFGLGGSVSPGFVSARGRDIHAGPYDDFLQIDASINRGNSGGPTFNLNGEVIGINTAIYSPNGGSVGIGFAIPSSLAKPVIDQLREHGKVDRGWLGVQIQQITPEIAKSLGLPKDQGALVADVTTDGPAAKAGFQQGDVILSFNGHDINKVRDLPIVVAETPVGSDAKVHVWRKSGETDLNAKIAQMPENPQIAQNGRGGNGNRDNGGSATAQNSSAMGLHLAPLSTEWRQRLHLNKEVKGVVITSIADNSPLADLGLQRGDVIESVNQKSVNSPSEVATALNDAKST